MTFFDGVIISVVGFCLIRGLFRGLIGEVSSIVGVLAGFYGAYTYYGILSPVLERWIATELYRQALSFFVLFVAIVVVIGMIALLMRYLLNIVFLGWVDRVCGMVFGSAKGVLIMAILLISLTTFAPGGTDITRGSRLSPYVLEIAQVITAFVSGSQGRELDGNLKQLSQLWDREKCQSPKQN